MEGEQPKPVPVDLKELSSLYPDTWTGIAQMRAVLALSNEALQASGVELVPIYDGEPLDDAEVIDRPRHGLITMDDAADTVMDARADELEHLSLFLDKLRVISHTSMYRYLYIRRTHINRLADRPPEGDSDGTTTK